MKLNVHFPPVESIRDFEPQRHIEPRRGLGTVVSIKAAVAIVTVPGDWALSSSALFLVFIKTFLRKDKQTEAPGASG